LIECNEIQNQIVGVFYLVPVWCQVLGGDGVFLSKAELEMFLSRREQNPKLDAVGEHKL
jgi:hypothetical protein